MHPIPQGPKEPEVPQASGATPGAAAPAGRLSRTMNALVKAVLHPVETVSSLFVRGRLSQTTPEGTKLTDLDPHTLAHIMALSRNERAFRGIAGMERAAPLAYLELTNNALSVLSRTIGYPEALASLEEEPAARQRILTFLVEVNATLPVEDRREVKSLFANTKELERFLHHASDFYLWWLLGDMFFVSGTPPGVPLHTIVAERLRTLLKDPAFVATKTSMNFAMESSGPNSGRLAAFLPLEIFDFVGLETIEVNNVGLFFIPSAIKNLRSLQSLNLRYNKISSIPDDVCKLPRLQNVLLDHNLITLIPDSIAELRESLEVLDLSENKIGTIPAALGKLGRLQRCCLHNNRITRIQEGSLSGLMRPPNGVLRFLSLQGNTLCEPTAEGLELVPNELLAISEGPTIDCFVTLSRRNPLDSTSTGASGAKIIFF